MTGTDWPCTAEEIIKQRDTLAQSWKQVAVALGLGEGKSNRGRWARRAYADLTGLSSHDSRPLGGRTPGAGSGSTGNGSRGRTTALRPEWDDDSDQDDIEAALLGIRKVSEKTGAVSWRPVHLVVKREFKGREFEEEVPCRYATAFSYGPEGDQPLQVTLVEDYAGATRTFLVSAIVRVAR